MNRRAFLFSSSALAVHGALSARNSPEVTGAAHIKASLRIDPARSSNSMAKDFAGLSYESAQLHNPDFFSPENTGLVKLLRDLSPNGVLRLGGNLSDYTFWSESDAPAAAAEEQDTAKKISGAYEWKLVDAAAAQPRYTVITPRAIRNLGAFLDKTGWRLIYGFNLGSGTAERAAKEAACVQQYAGSHLVAFQVGNEADFFPPRHRPRPYTFDQYWSEYQTYVQAVRGRVPGAPFAGPDIAARMDWVLAFAKGAGKDAALLTGHYYAMGPAEDPAMNAHHLLQRDPRLQKHFEIVAQATAVAGVPFRMTEGNSCFHGGKLGVSDAYASALWVADYMLFVAKNGYAGVNLHGGGDGAYAPIVGDTQRGITARPIYYGMQFAQQMAGGQFMDTEFDCGDANATAYAVLKGRTTVVAIVNKDERPLRVSISGNKRLKIHSAYELSGPSLDARSGVKLEEKPAKATADASGAAKVKPNSAIVLTV